MKRHLPFLLLTLLTALPVRAQTASIVGQVSDLETGESLVGANVIIVGTTTGSTTDVDGRYEITSVSPGTYSLRFSFLGFDPMIVEAVEVHAGETIHLDVRLSPESIGLDEVTVEVRALRDNQASLHRDRRLSGGVTDAISAEQISRSGSSTASDAMKKVTGATVVDGKHVYMRGLGDRYMGTQLNGAMLPSSDPDRNSVPLDLFPAALLDNIITTKTFTPDQPGSFTGGMVNIATRAFPESFLLRVSTSMGFNTQTTFRPSFLTAKGGNTDWLGIDDGTRAIPPLWTDPDIEPISPILARRDPVLARQLDARARAFIPVMTPSTSSAPVNQSYGLTIGNGIQFLGRPLGLLASITYHRDFETYQSGTEAQYLLTGRVSEVSELNAQQSLSDDRSSSEVLWGGLGTISYMPAQGHSVSLTYMHNHTGASEARFLSGPVPRNFAANRTLESRVISFTERRLQSLQLAGEHVIPALKRLQVDWSVARVATSHDEPDLRYFANDYTVRERGGVADTSYTIAISNYTAPSRYFRSLTEDGLDASLNLTLPVTIGFIRGSVKAGGAFNERDRAFSERRFQYQTNGPYDGDPEKYFSRVGVVDSSETATGYRYDIASYVIDATSPRNNYSGNQTVAAGYGMLDLRIGPSFRVITGARFETTRIDVASADPSISEAKLLNRDLLPSLNIVLERGAMNYRAAYGRTVARPTFRELAPFTSFNFINSPTLSGNPDLHRTLIDNFDLRWEWFMRPGEIAAISMFLKDFQSPIERTIINDNFETRYQNVDHARVYGAEFELQARLDRIAGFLSGFEAGGNVTLSHSRVDIAEQELVQIRAFDPEAPSRRSLQGQAPFVVNANLSYETSRSSVGLFYNIVGRRISDVTLGGTPNIYELPMRSVDVMASHTFRERLRIKASATNLLNAEVVRAYIFKDTNYYAERNGTGRSFSLGFTYGL